MTEGGPKERMSCSVVLTKVPANPVGALELERPFRVVPSDSATCVSHWIRSAAPEKRGDLGGSSLLQPRQSIRKADTRGLAGSVPSI